MPTYKRIASFLSKRISGLPRGGALARYLSNELRFQAAWRRRSDKMPYPNSVMLELTNCCNLDCVICPREYSYGQRMAIGTMDADAARKLLDEIGIYLDRLGLSGLGETFLYPRLNEVLSHIRTINPGVSIFVSSNLSLPNAADILQRVGSDIDTLQISIDGTGEVFESIRKKASYRLFLDNLKEVASIARRKKISIKFNMVVFGKNFHQMPDVVGIAADHGIDEVYLTRVNPVSIDAGLFDEGLYRSEEFRRVFMRARELGKEKHISVFYPESMTTDGNTLCRYPWNHIYVTWDGYMVPCCAKPFARELNFGNVFEKGFITCLNCKEFVEFRRVMKSGSMPGFCKGCC